MRQKRGECERFDPHVCTLLARLYQTRGQQGQAATHWTKNAGKPRSIRENATVDDGDDNQPRAARQGVTAINGPIHYFIDVHTMTVMYSYRISKAAAYRSTMGDPLKVKTISYKD